MKKQFVKTMFLVTACVLANSAQSATMISPKIGVVNWGQDTYDIGGNTIVLDGEGVISRGIEVAHVFDTGLRIGGEIQFQQLDVLSNSVGNQYNYVDVYQVTGTVSYHMPLGEVLTPFFGVGMGATRINLNGSSDDALDGDSYHGKVGLEIKMGPRASWIFAAKSSYLTARDNADKMKSTNNEVFIGVNLRAGK